MKDYIGHVNFEGATIKVKANSVAEARKKIKEKLKNDKAIKYLDKSNLFIGEWY